MPKRSYEQFCPVARALDVLGERWTLLIVRELLTGPQRYTDLRERLPGMWSNLLAQRLRDLEAGGLVARRELPPPAARTVYELTDRGRELDAVMQAIARFGLPYLDVPTEAQPVQPHLVPGGIRAIVRTEELPPSTLTIGFALEEGSWTLRIEPAGPPGRKRADVERLEVEEGLADDLDVTVRSSLPVLLWLRRGDVVWSDALEEGLVALSGSWPALAATRRLLGPGAVAAAA